MVKGTNCFLSGVAYSVGTPQSIESLREIEDISEEVLKDLKERGLRNFYQDSRTIPEMCISTAEETLKLTGLKHEEIDVILLATSNAAWVNTLDAETDLFSVFRKSGFVRTRLIGLALQACSAFGEAARIAADLISGQNPAKNVLIILFGRKETPSRIGPAASTIYSDGAASCIVSANHGSFEICASESVFNIHLGAMGRLGNLDQFVGGVQDITGISKNVLEKAGLQPQDISVLFCTNGSLVHLRVMGNAAKIAPERVYNEDVARFAHVYSCDNLISLKNYSMEKTLAPDSYYLLLGWSPHIVSAAILRYVGDYGSMEIAE
jgi:3-oxoacyl-[acyl-carrier-protein] synthase-3